MNAPAMRRWSISHRSSCAKRPSPLQRGCSNSYSGWRS
jgi:hypothetical protein